MPIKCKVSLILATSLIFYLLACKEEEKSQASSPYYILNGKDSIAANTSLYIETGCKEFIILPMSASKGGTIFISINGGEYFPIENPVELQDSIFKISAYVTHPQFERSSITYLNIHYESYNLEGTTLYPNPASDYTNLRIENSFTGTLTLTIFDFQGIILSKTNIDKSDDLLEIEIDVTDFERGIYIYKLNYFHCETLGRLIVNR